MGYLIAVLPEFVMGNCENLTIHRETCQKLIQKWSQPRIKIQKIKFKNLLQHHAPVQPIVNIKHLPRYFSQNEPSVFTPVITTSYVYLFTKSATTSFN